jgi:hypothetical protein
VARDEERLSFIRRMNKKPHNPVEVKHRKPRGSSQLTTELRRPTLNPKP